MSGDYQEPPLPDDVHCKHPHRKLKAFQTELLFDSKKNKIYVNPYQDRSVNRQYTCENQPIYSIVAHNTLHGYAYAMAAQNIYYSPSDFRNESMLVDLNGNPLKHELNPRHLDEAHRHHVLLKETLTEMVNRCFYNNCQISLKRRERNALGEKIPTIHIKYVNQNFDPKKHLTSGSVRHFSLSTTTISPTNNSKNPTRENDLMDVDGDFTFDQFRPLCCVESYPLPHHHKVQRDVLMLYNGGKPCFNDI